MPEVSWDELIEQNQAEKQKNEKKFIPQDGQTVDVIIGRNMPRGPVQKGDYVFYDIDVVHEGKEKVWTVFKNQAAEVGVLIKKRPNRTVTVSRSGKKTSIT